MSLVLSRKKSIRFYWWRY